MKYSGQVNMLRLGGFLDRRVTFQNLSVQLIQLLCSDSKDDTWREANQTANLLCNTHILEIQWVSCCGLSPSQPTFKGREQPGLFPRLITAAFLSLFFQWATKKQAHLSQSSRNPRVTMWT